VPIDNFAFKLKIVLTVSVLYFKISDRPVPDNKTVHTSENSAHKYKRPVSRIDFNEITRVCNPPNIIEYGDEGDIGIYSTKKCLLYSDSFYYSIFYFYRLAKQ